MRKTSTKPNFVCRGIIVNKTGLTLFARLDELAGSKLLITISLDLLAEREETHFNAPYLSNDEINIEVTPNQPQNIDVLRSYKIELTNTVSLKLEKENDTIDEEECSQEIIYSIKLWH